MSDENSNNLQNEDLSSDIMALFNILSRIGNRFQQYFSPILQNENIKALSVILKTMYMTDWLKYLLQNSIYRKCIYYGVIAWIIFADIAFTRRFSIPYLILNIPRAIISVLFIPFHVSVLILILLINLDRKINHVLTKPFVYLCFSAGSISFEIYQIILKNFKHWNKPLHAPFSSEYIRILWIKWGHPFCNTCYNISCKVWKAIRPSVIVLIKYLVYILYDIYLITLPLFRICFTIWYFITRVALAILSLIFTIVHSIMYTFRLLFSAIF